ncbi:nuclear pore complex assembly-domain-containing protein [Trametes gibbosa]|nr:nuclear pore complex assembly-domain-containing protein [Trametes gibbosa]
MNASVEADFLHYFELSPDQFPWRAPKPQEIETRRAHMSDMLVFDILLSSGGIRHPDTLFPPANPEALQRLLEAITHSNYDALKQDCLVYFLLKWHQDGREEEFKENHGIPPQFAALADAYWHLDSGINIGRAVSLLSDARLNRDYPSKILQALSLSENSSALIREYVRTAKPLLTEPDDIDAYTIALAESSLMEAWSYQRSFSEVSETKRRLVRKILDWSLTPKPRLAALTHLLAFPFTPNEQSLVHAYALEPPHNIPASSIPIIQDLVCVRLVQSGQHAAAIKLDRQFSSISRGGDKGQKVAQDRRHMMDELMAAMPAAERYLLELELENFSQGRGMDLSESISVSQSKGKTLDLSMSWEHLTPSTSTHNIGANGAAEPPSSLPISQRSNAPRFGGIPPVTSARNVPLVAVARPQPLVLSPSGVKMPKPPAGPFLFGGVAVQQRADGSLPHKGPLGKGATSASTGPSSHASAAPARSLFDVSGSANSAPNAFYQPPASTGQKRSIFGTLNAPADPRPAPTSVFAHLSGQANAQSKKADDAADTPARGPHDADISMLTALSDDEAAAGNDAPMSRVPPGEHTGGDGAHEEDEREEEAEEEAEEDSPAGFAQSVFGNVPSAHTRPIATPTGSRIARTMTEARLPPGAFLPDDDPQDNVQDHAERHEQEGSASAAHTRGARTTRASGSASISARTSARARRSPEPAQQQQQPSYAPTRSARARKPVRDADLGRSIPGSLMDDDDDDDDNDYEDDENNDGRHGYGREQVQQEEEEEDVIAPLPTPARRSSRKARTSNGGAADAPRVTRRSSRLSTVSSVGSSSPEPVSPQKISARARRGARASGAGAAASTVKAAGATRSGTRKKRA